jgi:hypothetical protein
VPGSGQSPHSLDLSVLCMKWSHLARVAMARWSKGHLEVFTLQVVEIALRDQEPWLVVFSQSWPATLPSIGHQGEPQPCC